jgi:hypothetical protein
VYDLLHTFAASSTGTLTVINCTLQDNPTLGGECSVAFHTCGNITIRDCTITLTRAASAYANSYVRFNTVQSGTLESTRNTITISDGAVGGAVYGWHLLSSGTGWTINATHDTYTLTGAGTIYGIYSQKPNATNTWNMHGTNLQDYTTSGTFVPPINWT